MRLLALLVGLLISVNYANAYSYGGIFPNDAINFNVDNPSGTSGTLLSAASSTRTILYGAIDCRTGVDTHIRVGTSGSDYIVDTEGIQNLERLSYEKLPPNTPLQYIKSNANDHCNFEVIYLNYNISSSTALFTIDNSNIQYSTSSSMNFNNDIGQLQVISTSTILSATSTQTIATYNFSFLLFFFIFLVVLSSGLIIYLFFKK